MQRVSDRETDNRGAQWQGMDGIRGRERVRGLFYITYRVNAKAKVSGNRRRIIR